MLYYTGHILDPLLNTVARWLINAEVRKEGRRYLLRCLNEGYHRWRGIVAKVEIGLEAALQALRAVKEEVVRFCREYEGLIEELTKYAVNAGAREIIGKLVAKAITREGGKQVTKVTIKTAANPLGIASDVTQTALEYVGYKEVGKTVGITGNIASGAMVGGAVGGPAGAAVGALLGFGVWGVGEVTGRLVDRALGE